MAACDLYRETCCHVTKIEKDKQRKANNLIFIPLSLIIAGEICARKTVDGSSFYPLLTQSLITINSLKCRKSLQLRDFFVTLRTKCAQMEIAQRYSIAHKGLKVGSYDFDFTVDAELFQAFESAEISDGNCRVSVHLERAEQRMTLDVQIEGDVTVVCDRCLEDCLVPIDYTGRLTVEISDDSGEYDGEVMWVLPAEDTVDLSQYIYESIVLSLPYQRVHPEGECNPEMLKRFKIVSGEEFAAVEAEAGEHESETISEDQREMLAALRDKLVAEEKK